MKKKQTTMHASEEFEFFIKSPLTKYKGNYVALLGKKVIASGRSAKTAWEKAKKLYPKKLPTIAKVPSEEVLVLLWK